MGEIRVLSDNMINLVSAGEVVERPASVVKELVENSIDAGAKNIKVEIKNGGKKLIHVSDDGKGISKNDIRLAFISHATSKICDESDLEKILTLGFRGEALSSVCSVSKIDMITSEQESTLGFHYKIEGGNEIFLKECYPRCGCSIMVRDLFFNTPARMKFLKKDITEGNCISSAVNHMILSHPEISFKFVRDGKDIVSSTGDGKLLSAILRVYGKDFVNKLIEIDYSLNNISIKGYMSDPDLSRSSKIQNFFINGRWIKDKIISNAIESALESEYKNNRISCIINIKIPAEVVDVNVHPAKSEVRFSNEKAVFNVIYNSIKDSINLHKNKIFNLSNANSNKYITKNKFNEKKENNETLHDNVVIPRLELNLNGLKTQNKNHNVTENTYFYNSNKKNKVSINPSLDKENTKMLQKNESKIKLLEYETNFVGEVFGCFLIFEYTDNIVLVDKHAAHERIIFDELVANKKNQQSQVLLSSLVLNFTRSNYENLLNNLSLVKEIGYKIEDFGSNKIIVREIPIYLNEKDIQSSLKEIAEFFSKNRSGKIDDLRKIYSSIACKSAIKSGKNSSEYEVKKLLESLIKSGVDNCPHGRPIYVSISKNNIYKKFLRK